MANLTKFWIRTRTWQKVQGTQSEDPAGHAPSQGTSPLSLAKEIEGAVRRIRTIKKINIFLRENMDLIFKFQFFTLRVTTRRVAINIQFIISNF